MALVTLADLRTQSRNRSDMRVNSIFTDADFNNAINLGIHELYDLQVKAWGDNYFLTCSIIPLQNGISSYNLPAALTASGSPQGIYKLAGVDWQQSNSANSQWYTLLPYDFNERNRYANSSVLTIVPYGTNLRYCMYGDNLNFIPTPQSNNNIQIWYIPQPNYLVADTDSYNFQAGWEEFVILCTCIKALAAEESDTSVFERQKAEMKDRILDMAPKRDFNMPHRVIDVETINSPWDDWF